MTLESEAGALNLIQYGVQEIDSCGHDVIIEAFWVKINYKEQKPENRIPSQRTVLWYIITCVNATIWESVVL